MKRILVTVALPEERFAFQETENIKFATTKVGKARAAYALTKAIAGFRPDIVLNIGTSATLKWNVGDILVASHFYDRDLAPLAIEGVVSELRTRNILPLPSVVNGERTDADFLVNTGDDFVTDPDNVKGDVIDMESFAQAMVCVEENIPFVAVKYITDRIGENSVAVWSDKLADARAALGDFFTREILPLL